MKKILTLTLFVAAISLLTSCKKKDEDPAPAANTPVVTTPAVNQPSATAPSLVAGASTTFSIEAGPADNADFFDIRDDVADPQGDDWSITNVTSSNMNVITVETSEGYGQFYYVGIAAGTATISITVADESGNTNVLTYTVTVTAAPINQAPTLNAGENTTFVMHQSTVQPWYLTSRITDAQGDAWTITNVTSSRPAVATATIGSGTKTINITAETVGDTYLSITVADTDGNSSTFNATVIVIAPVASPVGATQLP